MSCVVALTHWHPTSFVQLAGRGLTTRERLQHRARDCGVHAVAYDATDTIVEEAQEQAKESVPRTKVADLAVGQSVEGVVKKVVPNKGVVVDIGAEADGFLPATEFRDGFPTNLAELNTKKKVSARVMSINGERFYLTRRSVDLERPHRDQVRSLDGDVSAFMADESAGRWLEGEVISMTFSAVFVRLVPSNGGDPVSAILQQSDFADGFVEKVQLGSTVRVRVRHIDTARNRLAVTMRESAFKQASDLELGQVLKGTVMKTIPGKGVLVDCGVSRPGFLGVDEISDGFPKGLQEFTPGETEIEVRVLSKDANSDSFDLTRRSGALERPSRDLPKGDVSPFGMVSVDEPLDAVVVAMSLNAAFLAVTPPDDGDPVAGLLQKDDMTEDFMKQAAPGGHTTVNLKFVDTKKGRIGVTMKAHTLIRVEDLQIGESVKGTVRKIVPERGVLVDIGAARVGFLSVAEYKDGFPTNADYYRPGAKCKLRVLSVDGDRFTLTRRSGDLFRPEAEPLEDNDVSGFVSAVGQDTWFDGEVTAITLYGVFVKLTCPSTGLPIKGMLHQKNFEPEFVKQAALGMPVRVRVLSVRPEVKQLDLTML